jgi:cytoskeleton protein RodZ
VVFTALEDGIWVKFYDGAGSQLMQKQMAKGESYTVPGDANEPQVWTGRPDALAITVGGRPVAKLAERETIVRDVPVTAEALLGRNTAAAPAASDAPAGT